MTSKSKFLMAAAAFALTLSATSAWAGGLISIIVNDPSNPYWLTEGNVAAATAKKLGYDCQCSQAHKADTNTESQSRSTPPSPTSRSPSSSTRPTHPRLRSAP